jgi:uncharacterized protein (DUF1499 family)
MQQYAPEPMSVTSRWTSRVAVFSALLIVTAALAHRLFGMPTPVAFTVFKFSLAGAIVALVLGLTGAIGIWRTGRTGGARVLLGVVVSLAILSIPLVVIAATRDQVAIFDLTTDTVNPPEFVELAKFRDPTANPKDYPSAAFSNLQAAHFPDIAPLYIDRSVSEAYELVLEAARRMDFKIVREMPPGEGAADAGFIEAYDRTLVLGFYDDVSVRISGDEARTRIDLRSASRYGKYDFGANAERLRLFMKEIAVRLDETVPAADAESKSAKRQDGREGAKPGKEGDQKSARPRKQQNPARSDAQRAQERKARPQALD